MRTQAPPDHCHRFHSNCCRQKFRTGKDKSLEVLKKSAVARPSSAVSKLEHPIMHKAKVLHEQRTEGYCQTGYESPAKYPESLEPQSKECKDCFVLPLNCQTSVPRMCCNHLDFLVTHHGQPPLMLEQQVRGLILYTKLKLLWLLHVLQLKLASSLTCFVARRSKCVPNKLL